VQPPRVQAITFDVGGTLIEPWPSVGHVYAQVAAEQGINARTPEELNARFLSAWKALGGRAESSADWLAVVSKVFAGVDEVRDMQALFEALYERFTQPEVWHVFADVLPALDQLRSQGVRLAILSNWDDRLRPLLRRLGLAAYFEVMTISCEAGCRKPDTRIFQQAAAALQLSPGDLLHVGDSWELDVQGARCAGLHALHLCRGEAAMAPDACATLAEVPVRAGVN
jgi:putative hydrolase of the HAD superfamily